MQQNQPNDTWPLAKAKAKLSEVIRASKQTPQLIVCHGTLVAVLVNACEYREIMELRKSLILSRRCLLMQELDEINKYETKEFILQDRGSRDRVKLDKNN